MRRYLIIGLALVGALLVSYVVFYILKKASKKNSMFFSIMSGLITFIIILLACFFYLEQFSGSIDSKYNPPKYINGKVLEGEFNKN